MLWLQHSLVPRKPIDLSILPRHTSLPLHDSSYPQTDPDYEYSWVRDSSLTMDVVQMFYSAATKSGVKAKYENVLFEYATARATEQNDPGLQTGLGEPKVRTNFQWKLSDHANRSH